MADCDYSPVPVPADLRGPTGEEAQILIDGIARRIALFMGKRDWELDWHIYLDLRNQVEDQLRMGRLRGYEVPSPTSTTWSAAASGVDR